MYSPLAFIRGTDPSYSGRSMDLFQRVAAFRPDAVEGLKKALIDVITKDHSQGWAVSGHHDPSHARFKKDLDALKHELDWLVSPLRNVPSS